MKYLLTAQELTDLAKEVAAAFLSDEAATPPQERPLTMRQQEALVRQVLEDNGIKWDEGE